MKYLSAEDILVIHAKIIDEIGGVHGIRDTNLLISANHRPQTVVAGKEAYAGIFEKAAAYLEALVNYHVFSDGNKRTAIAVMAYFLHLNGFYLDCSDGEMVDVVLKISVEKTDVSLIAVWIKKYAKQKK